jgi:SAM-dependent methyltransferase
MNERTFPYLLYSDLATWWPVLSSPENYAEEAEFYRQAIVSASEHEIRSVVEFGSGGGNNASHLKQYFDLTLVDLSSEMLEVSKKLNSECEHIQGDMRSVRLDREFDSVFIHDAIVYMTSEIDLRAAIQTAYEHCRIGGVALFAPDYTRETFVPSTEHGGHDQEDRSLRYLQWTWDPDPSDTTYLSFMVYAMRTMDEEVRCAQDMHVCGLFGEQDWHRFIAEEGFSVRALAFEHREVQTVSLPIFLGLKSHR